MFKYEPHSLTLYDWLEYFNLDPFHVYGFCVCTGNNKVVVDGCNCSCNEHWREFGSFSKQIARETISRAIALAESKLMDSWLGFAPAPRQFLDTLVNYEPGSWYQTGGNYKTAIMPYQHIQSFGVYVDTLLDEYLLTRAVPIVYRQQTFRVENVLVPVGTTTDQIVAYISEGDRFDQPKEGWQIEPLGRVTIDTNTWLATIEIPAYLLADPDLTHLSGQQPCLDKDNLESYVETVEVYVRTLDRCQQGIAYGRGGCSNPPCESQQQTVCFGINNSKLGFASVTPAMCDDSQMLEAQICSAAFSEVKEIKANWIGGYPLQNGRMAYAMRAAVSELSAALLHCELPHCMCNDCCLYEAVTSRRRVPKVKTDEGAAGITGDRYTLLLDKNKIKQYPLGTSTGALEAYLQTWSLRSIK